MSTFKAGQTVRVNPHTTYGDLRQGAVQSQMHQHQHNGYKKAVVEAIFKDGSAEVFVPGFGIDYVPVTSLELL